MLSTTRKKDDDEETKPLLLQAQTSGGDHDATTTSRTTTTCNGALSDRWPSQNATCCSSVFFSWVTPLMRLGNQRPLENQDLFQLDPWNRSNSLSQRFKAQWEQQKRHATSGKPPSLVWALSLAFGGEFVAAGLLKLVHDSLQFVGPLIIKRIVTFLRDPLATTEQGLIYVAIIFVAGVIQSFALRQYFFYCYATGMRLRSAVATAVFNKSLVLSSSARQKKTTGEITNLMSIDAQRLQDLTPYLHALWYAAFQIGVSCYLLYLQIGLATFAGVGVIVVLVAMTSCISRLMRNLQRRLMQVKDERIKVCHEVLTGIKVIKLQAWENSFINRVMAYRAEELSRLRAYICAQSLSSTLFSFMPALVSVVSFVVYVWLGGVLDVGSALTSLALFNVMRFPLFMLPQVINNVVEASVSFDRLQKFLLEEEYQKVGSGTLSDVGVLMEDADFTWKSSTNDMPKHDPSATTNPELKELLSPADETSAVVQDDAILRNINFEAHQGQLIAIVGQVGSGKSTLLAGLLGDANIVKGQVAIRGSVAYVAQQPFIMNATVRDNICFGLPFDRTRYDEAIRVSCLEKDILILPGGDLTEIGEKGINLSGGQRTRVAIARAVYQDADVYILDDILSAVDSHVGSDIFTKCIKTCLKSKLVLLVTHSLSFLNQCDRVLVVDQGEIAEQGLFKNLMNSGGLLFTMVSSYVEVQTEEDDGSASSEVLEEADAERECAEDSSAWENATDSRLSHFSSVGSEILEETVADKHQLMTNEDRSTGEVKWSVYRAWLQAFGGSCAGIVVICSYVLAQGITLLSTFWISYWSEKAASFPQNQVYYANVYVAMNGAFALALFVRALMLYLGGLRASRILFGALLSRVLRAPVVFFDTTPLGRIVNRLSKDVYTVDENIPSSWHMLVAPVVTVLTTLVTISYVTPVFMVVLFPVVVVYYSSQRYYIKTSRELQRLDSISRSPILALLTETLDGTSTIRACKMQPDFIYRNECLLDTNQRAYFLSFSINCWLALRLEFIGTLIAAAAALSAVMAHNTSSTTFAGLAGVSLTYAFSVTQFLNWTVRMASRLQTQMVSVERIKHYAEMEMEPPLESERDRKPAHDWPQQGEICFEHVGLRYRPGLPRVLRNLSFTVKPREKIGIVGRTGAGKSSLIVALMRLTELDSGVIKIDGVDISTIGLHDLRGKISIIPQDPVLFSGSVRANLDPFDQFSDDQIWTSIKRAHLQNAVTALDEKVEERGSNFSVGERQLLCIARALLRRSRVILMDEATASIDTETDRKIQQSIREEFKDCTCLTVAHRINTILDSDRVLVMDKGKVAEFDTPAELQRHPKGIFRSLVVHWRQDQVEGC